MWQVDRALEAREAELELKRLERVSSSIKDLQRRIDDGSSKLSVARLAKLV